MILLLLTACAVPWEEHDLTVTSDEVGDSYDVRVVVPEIATVGDWPVLAFQDGDYCPGHRGTLRSAIHDGAPPFVLIAVGYQGFETGVTGGLSDDTLDRRLRDITEAPIDGVPGTGGAPVYQAFWTPSVGPRDLRRRLRRQPKPAPVRRAHLLRRRRPRRGHALGLGAVHHRRRRSRGRSGPGRPARLARRRRSARPRGHAHDLRRQEPQGRAEAGVRGVSGGAGQPLVKRAHRVLKEPGSALG